MAPMKEIKIGKRFFNDLDKAVDKVDNGYEVFLLENLNKLIGDRVKASITVAFGVPEESDNER